jgi:hypothetical protein
VAHHISIDCGGASSLAYAITICNGVTRASLNKVGQNLLTTHFLASLHVCDTIEGLRLAMNGSSPSHGKIVIEINI